MQYLLLKNTLQSGFEIGLVAFKSQKQNYNIKNSSQLLYDSNLSSSDDDSSNSLPYSRPSNKEKQNFDGGRGGGDLSSSD